MQELEREPLAFSLEILDYKAIENVLGESLMIGFFRGFSAANRLGGLRDLHRLVSPLEQNDFTLRMIYALFYETVVVAGVMSKALHDIDVQLKNRRIIPHPEPWSRLTAQRVHWNSDLSKGLRDKVAAHIDADLIKEGIRRRLEDPEPIFVGRYLNGEILLAQSDLSLRGLISPEEMGEYLKSATGVHELPSSLLGVFVALLLDHTGIPRRAFRVAEVPLARTPNSLAGIGPGTGGTNHDA